MENNIFVCYSLKIIFLSSRVWIILFNGKDKDLKWLCVLKVMMVVLVNERWKFEDKYSGFRIVGYLV